MSSWPSWPSAVPNPFSSRPAAPPPPSHSAPSSITHSRSPSDDPDDAATPLTRLTTALSTLPPPVLAGGSLVLGGLGALGAARVYARHVRRVRTAGCVTQDMIDQRRWVRGVVTRVGDADNFHLYHTPGPGWRWPFKWRRVPTSSRALERDTIHVRIAGIDAPEAPHFGLPGQVGAAAALAWLKKAIEGKTLWCQLLRKDQYFRVVAMPYLPHRVLPGRWFLGRPLPLEMLRAGYAWTYEQANAEYGPFGRDAFLAVQRKAMAKKRGLWRDGPDRESPVQYKKRAPAMDPAALAAERAGVKAKETEYVLKTLKGKVPKKKVKGKAPKEKVKGKVRKERRRTT